MTVQIDTTAESNGVRLVKQGSHPSAPSTGHVLLYYITGTANPGMFVEDSGGAKYGPFITGTSGGGGGTSPYYLDTIALDGTYGDHFTAATLDAKWTRHNLGSSDDVRQSANGSWLRTTFDNAHADEMYLQSAPAGDWEIQCKLARVSFLDNSMYGILAVDASGNGCVFMFFVDNNMNLGSLSSYGWGSVGSGQSGAGYLPQYGQTVWLSLARTGTSYVGRVSYDGTNWAKSTGAVTYTNTIDRFGFGRVYGAIAGEVMVIDWFNKL